MVKRGLDHAYGKYLLTRILKEFTLQFMSSILFSMNFRNLNEYLKLLIGKRILEIGKHWTVHGPKAAHNLAAPTWPSGQIGPGRPMSVARACWAQSPHPRPARWHASWWLTDRYWRKRRAGRAGGVPGERAGQDKRWRGSPRTSDIGGAEEGLGRRHSPVMGSLAAASNDGEELL
jgi:hypothetical protein